MLSSCLSSQAGALTKEELGDIHLASHYKECMFGFTEEAQQVFKAVKRFPFTLRPPPFDAHEILPGKLWLGGVGAAQEYPLLLACRIRYIFTVADGCVHVQRRGGFMPHSGGPYNWIFGDIVDHAVLEVMDSPVVNIAQHFDQCVKWLTYAMQRGAVLVHCVQGISRSVSVVLALLIAQHDMTLQQALDFVKEKRPCARPNYGFLAQLARFEQQCRAPVPYAAVVAAEGGTSSSSSAAANTTSKGNKKEEEGG